MKVNINEERYLEKEKIQDINKKILTKLRSIKLGYIEYVYGECKNGNDNEIDENSIVALEDNKEIIDKAIQEGLNKRYKTYKTIEEESSNSETLFLQTLCLQLNPLYDENTPLSLLENDYPLIYDNLPNNLKKIDKEDLSKDDKEDLSEDEKEKAKQYVEQLEYINNIDDSLILLNTKRREINESIKEILENFNNTNSNDLSLLQEGIYELDNIKDEINSKKEEIIEKHINFQDLFFEEINKIKDKIKKTVRMVNQEIKNLKK